MMCYAIGVCNHYFSAEQIPEYNSTDDFLRCHLPAVIWSNTQQQVYVFFHQYLSIKSCKPAMYNHFASPIPEPHCSGAVQTFNAESRKEISKLSKIEQKQLNKARILHYLKLKKFLSRFKTRRCS
jgi:hypothetical protein